MVINVLVQHMHNNPTGLPYTNFLSHHYIIVHF